MNNQSLINLELAKQKLAEASKLIDAISVNEMAIEQRILAARREGCMQGRAEAMKEAYPALHGASEATQHGPFAEAIDEEKARIEKATGILVIWSQEAGCCEPSIAVRSALGEETNVADLIPRLIPGIEMRGGPTKHHVEISVCLI